MNNKIYPKLPVNFYVNEDKAKNNPAFINSALLIKNEKVHFIRVFKYSSSSDLPIEFEYAKYSVSNFFETIQQSDSILKSLDNNHLSVLKKIFPTATRFISENGSILIERPPFRYTIDFTPVKAAKVNKKSSKKIEPITVWVPWTVYRMQVDKYGTFDVTIHFNDSPMSSLNDYVFPCIFPNVFNGGQICFGSDYAINSTFIEDSIKDNTYSYKELFNYLISNYYNGGWNTDILPSSSDIPMFMLFQSYDRIKELNDPVALEIYSNAMAKCTLIKHKDSYIEMYLNALNIWSKYSLEELLYLYKTCIDPFIVRQLVSLSSLINVNFETRSFRRSMTKLDEHFRSMMFKPSYHDYNKTVKVLRYDRDPINGKKYFCSNNLLQQDVYEILNNIIAYEDSKNTSTIVNTF